MTLIKQTFTLSVHSRILRSYMVALSSDAHIWELSLDSLLEVFLRMNFTDVRIYYLCFVPLPL
jgi:hypothetical protein